MVKESNQKYVQVKIPREFADRIDENFMRKWGYTSLAEVCKDGVRAILRKQNKKEAPP